ncbi:unnamed protein product [Coffea canephora]|uniref:Uncharacterized protein n=1 Tax=Coffea canephora TaxID=49390 RepID=A0A068V8F4_COFCA|nr:unnamed protein product [Coffea canephora]
MLSTKLMHSAATAELVEMLLKSTEFQGYAFDGAKVKKREKETGNLEKRCCLYFGLPNRSSFLLLNFVQLN